MPHPNLDRRRRRRFAELLAWNIAGTVALTLPLWLLLRQALGPTTAWAMAAGFGTLLLFMGAVLAGYFAYLRADE